MSEITTVGLDLAKNVFPVHAVDAEGATVLRKQLRRPQVLESLSGGVGGVKAYVKRNKSDAADAEAICEAVVRPRSNVIRCPSARQAYECGAS